MAETHGVIRFRELRFTLRMLARSKVVLASIGIIAFFYAMAIAPWLFTSADPYKLNMGAILAAPNIAHPIGTDQLGRDVLSRVIWGTRYSMFIGFVVVAIQSAIGIPLGAIAGYMGGTIDNIIMRVTDMFLAFPGIILAMFLADAMGRGLISVFIALGLVYWTYLARLIRGVVLSEKEKEYVTAARAIGKSNFSILFLEILPNAIQPAIISATLSLGGAIVESSALSFIGVGIQPPTPDWGSIVSGGETYLLDKPLISLTPGFFMIVVVLAFNILGDALRDALDPRLRREVKGG